MAPARSSSMQVANTAHSDFLRVRRKAFWRGIAKWLLRSDDALLAFDDVRKQLHAHLQHDGGVREVEIDQIVGSVGRYRDFDRAFLPRQARTRGRWESIDTAYLTHVELPPIELYKIGETYFVKDGNHRVSVARERGQVFVDARVIEVESPAPVTSVEDLVEGPRHVRLHRALPRGRARVLSQQGRCPRRDRQQIPARPQRPSAEAAHPDDPTKGATLSPELGRRPPGTGHFIEPASRPWTK